jgi:D-alanyl-D-alanine carboxypeptidase
MARLLDAAFEKVNDRRFLASAPSLDAGPAGDDGPEEVLVASAEPVPLLPSRAMVQVTSAIAPLPAAAPVVVDARPRERTIPGLIAAAYASPEPETKPEPVGLRMQPILLPPPPERPRSEPIIARSQPARPAPVEEGGDWSIQVGAFISEESAKRAARDAVSLLGSSAQTRVTATNRVPGGKTMYRAQLVGLSRGAADNACRNLSAKDRPCAVLQADARNLASAR